MEFLNQTTHSAELIHGPLGSNHHGVCVLAKQTRPILPGLPGPSEPFEWPVSRTELKTDFGDFPFEHHFPLAKLDLMVVGHAVTPQKRPMREMRVGLSVGSQFQYIQHIFGDRQWKKSLLDYKIGEPDLFTEMPLTLKNAFGGTIEMENAKLQNLDNPEGKGYLVKGVSIEGTPLPNIERPNHLIRHPFDEPMPTCMAPYPLAGRLRYLDKVSPQGAKPFAKEDCNSYFGQAHPDLVMERLAPGTPIRIEGMHATEIFSFTVPACPFRATVEIDSRVEPLRFSLDAICVFTHLNRVGFRYRAASSFHLEPRQLRKVSLEEVAA